MYLHTHTQSAVLRSLVALYLAKFCSRNIFTIFSSFFIHKQHSQMNSNYFPSFVSRTVKTHVNICIL